MRRLFSTRPRCHVDAVCLSIDACFRFEIRPLLFLVPAKVRLILVFESLQFFSLQILELIADYHSSVLILCAGEVVLSF